MADASDSHPREQALSLTALLRQLVAGNVEFVVCGGVACVMHGVSRTTADLDIAVSMDIANLQRLIAVAQRLGLQPRIPEPLEALADPQKRREWIEQKNATVFTLVSAAHPIQVDIFLRYPISFDELKSRANAMTGRDVTFLVSSIPDLLTAKRIAGREQDQRDIQDLERIVRDEKP